MSVQSQGKVFAAAMTGTSRIGSHLALALKGSPVPGSKGPRTHLYRARLDAQLSASFFGEAILSGILMSFIKAFALLPAIAMMVALLLLSIANSCAATYGRLMSPGNTFWWAPGGAERPKACAVVVVTPSPNRFEHYLGD
jgi:hypothetical protein